MYSLSVKYHYYSICKYLCQYITLGLTWLNSLHGCYYGHVPSLLSIYRGVFYVFVLPYLSVCCIFVVDLIVCIDKYNVFIVALYIFIITENVIWHINNSENCFSETIAYMRDAYVYSIGLQCIGIDCFHIKVILGLYIVYMLSNYLYIFSCKCFGLLLIVCGLFLLVFLLEYYVLFYNPT